MERQTLLVPEAAYAFCSSSCAATAKSASSTSCFGAAATSASTMAAALVIRMRPCARVCSRALRSASSGTRVSWSAIIAWRRPSRRSRSARFAARFATAWARRTASSLRAATQKSTTRCRGIGGLKHLRRQGYTSASKKACARPTLAKARMRRALIRLAVKNFT